MDNVASGAVKRILTMTDVTALVGAYVAPSPNAGLPWVFNSDVFTTVEGSGQAAIVCADFGNYSVPRPLSTPQFLRLAVRIWVDPARDASNNITESSGATVARGRKIFTTLNFHLNFTSGATQQWGDMVVTASQLLTGPHFMPIEDIGSITSERQGMTSKPQTGVAYYGVDVFGYTDAVS